MGYKKISCLSAGIWRLTFIIGIMLLSGAPVHAADTGWLNPTANLAGPLYNGFEANPDGAYASGGLIAQDARTSGSGNRGDEHRYYGFDLSSLPAGATVTGIQVKLTAWKDRNPAANMEVMVSKNGVDIWTGSLLSATLTTTLTNYTLGSSTELWGLGVTHGSELKATSSTFVIKIKDTAGANAQQTWYLDWLQVRIYYDFVPDLTISKTHAGSFTQGQTGAQYTITVTNSGTGPTVGAVTVTDTLPVGLTPTGTSVNGWTYTKTSATTCTFTRSDVLAIGTSYPAIALTVDVASDALPAVINTAVASGGGEINTANNTVTDPTTIIQHVSTLNVTKSVTDENGGNLKIGDYLLYTVVVQNLTGGYLTGAEFTDALPGNTTYVAGSVTRPSGSTIVTETPTLDITGINVPAHSQVTITFRVLVDGGTEVSNQGSVAFDTDGNGVNDDTRLSDGDTETPGEQPTVIPISTGSEPNFSQTAKSVTLKTEVSPIDGAISPGDTLEYTVVIPNTGDADASGVTFADLIPTNTTYVSGSVTATSGAASFNAVPPRIDWAGDINFSAAVTLAFDVTVNSGVAVGTVISNQGAVTYAFGTVQTDGDLTNPGKQKTDVTLGGIPHITAVKSVVDENGNYLEPGDTLLYTIVIDNTSLYKVDGMAFTDVIPNNTTYVAGSATIPAGSTLVTDSPTLYITGINLPANNPGSPDADKQTITFRVTVNGSIPSGVNMISNQGTVFYDINGDTTNDTILPTDGDNTQPGYQPTTISLGVAPNFELTTKSAALVSDPDGNQAITPGDTVRYNIKVRNTGSLDATGVALIDPIPSHMTFAGIVSGGATFNGTLNQVEWTGNVAKGTMSVIEFDVTVNSGTSLGTVISNQGTIFYDSDNNGINDSSVLTDGDTTVPGKQTTDVTVGSAAHGFGVKTAADVNGGHLELGDIVLYTIVIYNESGFYGNGIEFTDPIPSHTTLTGSVTAPAGCTIVTQTPTLYIKGITIPPHSNVSISFTVKVDNTLPDGVSQISNQADVFYDSNSDGINDTHQSTDGDLTQPGNQPTVSIVYCGTISGTVFDDNGAGVGGIAGNGIQDGSEPGISGVTVEVYDPFFVLEFSTTTGVLGDYLFGDLLPGTHEVRETNPPDYTSTTPDLVTVTAENTATANFGDQYFPSGGADLEITKTCAALFPGGLPQQEICTIRVKNDGPETATGVLLTDNFPAPPALAGLNNINYTLDDVLPAVAWTGSLSLGSSGDMISGESHAIRIYADVPAGFKPALNTAIVTSDNDPFTENNTIFCMNTVSKEVRRAINFPTGVSGYVSARCDGHFCLTENGTLEAWIYPASFAKDAGIITKGTAEACYGLGLGAGSLFSAGTSSQNICFVIFEQDGTKHAVAADFQLEANKWYHVACAWSGSAPGDIDISIYINGIEKEATTETFADAVRTNGENLLMGMQSVVTPGDYFGVMDEVRVWDTARTQPEIQAAMCHKITNSDPDFANLMGYWRFDEESGYVCGDYSGNGHLGTITNAERICSSAPIGDASGYHYLGSAPADFEVDMGSSGTDHLTITGDGGTWDETEDSCLQVYRVDAAPYNATAPLSWKPFYTSLRYWGVFVAGGTAPTYTMVYHYAGYPDITNENELKMGFRKDNCDNWKDSTATLSTSDHTLTKSGLGGTEFILGSAMDPRNDINYHGSTGYVEVKDESTLQLDNAGTLEAWIYPESLTAGAGIVLKGITDGGGASSVCYGFGLGGGAGAVFTSGASTNIDFVLGYTSGAGGVYQLAGTTSPNLAANKWYHVACVWENSASDYRAIYVNGVQYAFSTATIDDVTTSNAGNLRFGIDSITTPTYIHFDGQIDEVRIWKVARSQSDIQTNMCRKIDSRDPDLVGYWRFDEETVSDTSYDFGTTPYNFATMYGFGFGTAGDIITARSCSSAPIGDASAYDYGTSATTSSAKLTTPVYGDYFFATEYTAGGGWGNALSGIQIYRVDGAPVYPPDINGPLPYDPYTTPNGLTPPAGWASIDYYRYFGAFPTDWVNSPTYDVIYHYAGNPSVPAGINKADPSAPQIGLAKRPVFCNRTWSDSTAYWAFGTDQLELAGPGKAQSANPEYVLGGINQPLAIALASFTAKVVDGCIEIFWETATEIDTVAFQLWRSESRDGPYTLVPYSYTKSKSVMESTGARYCFTDCDAVLDGKTKYYYKLEEIDMDNSKANPFYGPFGPVAETVTATQESGLASSKNDKACFISTLLE